MKTIILSLLLCSRIALAVTSSFDGINITGSTGNVPTKSAVSASIASGTVAYSTNSMWATHSDVATAASSSTTADSATTAANWSGSTSMQSSINAKQDTASAVTLGLGSGQALAATGGTGTNITLTGASYLSGVLRTDTNGIINTKQSGFLLAGFSGGFLTGRERAFLLYSQNGTSYAFLSGLDGYNPPDGGGLRDCMITKVPGKYLLCYTASYSGGTRSYFSVASSTDLITWTHTADVTASITAPKWFSDPDTGKLYAMNYNNIVECTSKDGVTWGASSAITYSGTGGYSGDQFLLKKSGTYYLFAWPTSGARYYHVFKSASIASGYVDQGAISGWYDTEGLGIFLDNSGTYWAYSNPRSGPLGTVMVYSKTTNIDDLSSWSAMSALSPRSNGRNIDNGAGMVVNDADAFRDVASAMTGQLGTTFLPAEPDSPFNYQFQFPLSLNLHAKSYAGVGTISSSGTAVTGIGTLFTHQLQIGSTIVDGTNHYGFVSAITSDTTCSVLSSTSFSGAFTFDPPSTTWGNGNPSNPSTYVTGPGNASGGDIGGVTVFGNQTAWWSNPSSGVVWTVDMTSGGWNLRDVHNNRNVLVVQAGANGNALVLTGGGAQTTGLAVNSSFQTFTGGVSGTMSMTQPFNGTSYKKVVATLTNVTGSGVGGDFPVPFTNTPAVIVTTGTAHLFISTNTTASLRVTGTAISGTIIVEGY